MSDDAWSVSHTPVRVRKPGSRVTIRYSAESTMPTTIHSTTPRSAHWLARRAPGESCVARDLTASQDPQVNSAASGRVVYGWWIPSEAVVAAARARATSTTTTNSGVPLHPTRPKGSTTDRIRVRRASGAVFTSGHYQSEGVACGAARRCKVGRRG